MKHKVVGVSKFHWKTLQRAGGIALFARTLTMLVGLILTSMLSRALDPTELGRYWIALSALSFVALIAQNGVGQITMSRVSQSIALGKVADAKRAAQNSVLLVMIFGICASLLVGLGTVAMYQALGRNLDLGMVGFISVGGVLCSLSMQFVDLLRAQQRLTSASLLAAQPASGGLVPTCILIMLLWLINAAEPATHMQTADVYKFFLVGWGATVAISLCLLWSGGVVQLWPFESSFGAMSELAVASLPILFSAVTMFVITQADIWTVDRVLGSVDTAAYGIASSFVKYVSAINVLMAALMPGIVGELFARQDKVALHGVLVRAARVSALASLGIFAILALGGERLLGLIVGDRYSNAFTPLLVLSIGHLVNALLGYSNIALVTAHRNASIVAASLLASLVTIVLLFTLTPRFGMVGAATASALGVVTYNVTTWLQCGRQLGLWCHAFAPLSKNSVH